MRVGLCIDGCRLTQHGAIHVVDKALMAQASSSSFAHHPGDGAGRPLFIGYVDFSVGLHGK